ncbi:ethylene-responsive nuclear protein / ethylene-regulated nuclear protein (ERT2) [Euphorbia peplus]|nr:ethylene-responsive nuclear protein / ethylene-regulated nuclear protein (ERT2) [Euphorbia peplus]
MPSPWKKAAGLSRITRFMADLHPTKPCTSMVVQTGFPTSLVDLFVKNSCRLKKPTKKNKKKKKKLHHITHPHHTPSVHVSDPSVVQDHVHFMIKDNNLDVGIINQESNNKDRRKGGFLYAVFMVIVVVILALISVQKILTLGITMSACLFIFVDYIGMCNFVRFKGVFLFKEEDKREFVVTDSKEEDEQEEEEEEEGEGEDSVELNSPRQEIQVVQSRFDAFAAEPDNNDGKAMNLMSGRWGYSEADESEAIITRETHHKLRRRASREFIKKLVPKKWRAMKKARKGKETSEESGSSDLSNHSNSSIHEEMEELYNSDSKPSKLSDSSIELGTKSDSSIELGTKSENETSVIEKPYKEEAVIKKERKGGCDAILLLVALAGLVGGRILALGLTVASCVIIQLVRRAQKQSVKKTL